MSNRFTMTRVGKESPYVDYNLRCRYAVEYMEAITAPADAQIIMLELTYGIRRD
jgi:hypothetical protein